MITAVAALLVLLWARESRTRWRELGFVRPKSWIGAITLGIAFGVTFKLLMKAVVMPLLGADPINPTSHFLVGNSAAIPGMLFSVIVVAGVGEETVYRGYFFERLRKLFGNGRGARAAIVLATAALFGAAHLYDQGIAGAEQATIVGLVYGGIFARTGRLFMLMCAHAAFDVTAVAIIYLNLERSVAHWVF